MRGYTKHRARNDAAERAPERKCPDGQILERRAIQKQNIERIAAARANRKHNSRELTACVSPSHQHNGGHAQRKRRELERVHPLAKQQHANEHHHGGIHKVQRGRHARGQVRIGRIQQNCGQPLPCDKREQRVPQEPSFEQDRLFVGRRQNRRQ
ncbi:hypothetical protein SDC9_131733 [bioreactor metagenome]|uniref:Uncharacterized protein n=1 Tax=bioreactor metagenome TaxID=1076179 RepID=A0A645D586_9ZZZZ